MYSHSHRHGHMSPPLMGRPPIIGAPLGGIPLGGPLGGPLGMAGPMGMVGPMGMAGPMGMVPPMIPPWGFPGLFLSTSGGKIDQAQFKTEVEKLLVKYIEHNKGDWKTLIENAAATADKTSPGTGKAAADTKLTDLQNSLILAVQTTIKDLVDALVKKKINISTGVPITVSNKNLKLGSFIDDFNRNINTIINNTINELR